MGLSPLNPVTLTLTRARFEADGIFGELTNGDKHVCYTLEHSFDSVPAVPAGTYTCKRGQHRLGGMANNFITFEVQNVPGHTGILFHTGNTNRDSEGCILLGQQIKGAVLLNSRPAFASFMELLDRLPQFTLEVK